MESWSTGADRTVIEAVVALTRVCSIIFGQHQRIFISKM